MNSVSLVQLLHKTPIRTHLSAAAELEAISVYLAKICIDSMYTSKYHCGEYVTLIIFIFL